MEKHEPHCNLEMKKGMGCAVYHVDGKCDWNTCTCSPTKIEIVPSERIDYCGNCNKEHGYECPKDSPTPTLRGWKDKAALLAARCCSAVYADDIEASTNEMLAFISSEIAIQVEAEKEKIREWAESFYLDVAVIKCDCGEPYKDSDLGIRVTELKSILTSPDTGK